MTKSLLHGATKIFSVGLVVVCFASWSPFWLVVRTELEINQCWFGQGIYNANFWWGSNLPKANFKCEEPHNEHGSAVFQEYCLEPSSLLCHTIEYAKVYSSVAIAFALLTFALVALQMCYSGISVMQVQLGIASSVTSLVFGWLTWQTMWTSDMFSNSHLLELSKVLNDGPRPLELFSCSLQTLIKPSYAPFFFGSAPMECTFPGPSVLAMFVFFLAQSLGTAFLIAVVRDERRKRNVMQHYDDDDDDDVLPASFHRVRRYSLYGASMRRVYRLRQWKQTLLVTALPFVLIISNAGTWLAYVMIGIQIIVNVRIAITSNEHLQQQQQQHAYWHLTNSTLSSVFPEYMALAMSDTDFAPHHGELIIFDDTLNPFNFGPMSSFYFFWDIGAYLIFATIFLGLFILPVGKVLLWIWFFYLPIHEITRGKWLMMIDAVGKYSLANLYVMILITISLTFSSDFIVIPLSRNESFLVRVRAGINAGNGWGSYLFVATTVLSLFIGQFMVQLHRFASVWEEKRRMRKGLGYASSPTTMTTTISATPMVEENQSPMEYYCTSTAFSSAAAVATYNDNSVAASRGGISSSLAASLIGLSSHHHRRHSTNAEDGILNVLSQYGRGAALHVGHHHHSNEEEEEYIMLEDASHANWQKLQLHQYVEAMCDRVHSPLHGVQVKFTPCGKTLAWFLVFCIVAMILILQSVPLFEVHKFGLAGDVIIRPRYRYKTFSLLYLTQDVADIGYEVPAVELSMLFFVMTAIMPVLTVWGLAVMWGIPLTLKRQEILFNWLEIAAAWSSLDIFFLSVLVVHLEVENVISNIVANAVPNISLWLRIFIPFVDEIMNSSMRLESGFWLLLSAVLVEKLAIYLITENAAQAISERRSESFLQDLTLTVRSPNGERMVADASEGLLETDAVLAFAPAGRYVSAMFPRTFYAGIPRNWWVSIGIRTGLVANAREVDFFDKTGKSLADTAAAMRRSEENA